MFILLSRYEAVTSPSPLLPVQRRANLLRLPGPSTQLPRVPQIAVPEQLQRVEQPPFLVPVGAAEAGQRRPRRFSQATSIAITSTTAERPAERPNVLLHRLHPPLLVDHAPDNGVVQRRQRSGSSTVAEAARLGMLNKSVRVVVVHMLLARLLV